MAVVTAVTFTSRAAEARVGAGRARERVMDRKPNRTGADRRADKKVKPVQLKNLGAKPLELPLDKKAAKQLTLSGLN